MPKTTPNRLKAAREKLGLSQEAVARLLGVSLRSVTRWEAGEFESSTGGNDAILQLLPFLAEGKVPQPCKEARKHGLDTTFLAQHVRGCDQCRLAVLYLYMMAKPNEKEKGA